MRPIRFFLLDLFRWTGIRNRLRCPRCSAVGTWKNHGGWADFEDERKVKRWLCKWCGFYVGPEGERRIGVDTEAGCWSLEKQSDLTPQYVVRHSPIAGAFPWRG